MQSIPDRYQRAALLAATGWLPQAVRVRARRQLLWSRHAAITRRADAVIIVHPKSGGTWLRTMLFRIYQQKYDLPGRRVMKTDELQRVNPALPRLVVSNGYYSYESAVMDTLVRHGADDKRLVLMARHPCDIAVSWYHQFTVRISERKRELIAHDMKTPIDYRNISMWEFLMHPEIGLPGIIEYHNRWARFFADRDNAMIVRYEDLRSQPAEHLRRVAQALGETVTEAQIEDAVAFASMENMRKLEAEQYFTNSSLRQKKRGNPDTKKVRRGKVGGYRDDLSPEQVATMDAMVRERLDPSFGYD